MWKSKRDKARKSVIFPILAAALLLGGCSQAEKGTIEIVSITPDPAVALRVGEKVHMEAVVKYTLNRKAGRTDIVVQKKGGIAIGPLKELISLPRGSGTILLRQGFRVPDTSEIRVFVPFYSAGSAETTGIVDTRLYKVLPK